MLSIGGGMEKQESISMVKICKQCGKEFARSRQRNGQYESWVKFNKRKYCSNACCIESLKKHYEKTCPICGKIFVTNRNDKICCGIKCGHILGARKTRKPPEKKICVYCGKEFFNRRKDGKVNTQWSIRKFCSRECAVEYRRGQLTDGQIEIIQRYWHHWGGKTKCAKRIHIRAEYLAKRIERYEREHGPINYELITQKVESKPIDIKTEYSQAWIDCAEILNRMKENHQIGKAELISVDKKIQEQIWRTGQAEIKHKYERLI
jgi:hypothetical protein